jgi:hypothetical protein
VEIEGESTKDMANQDVVARLKGAKGTKVGITVERPGLEKTLAFTIARDKIPIYSVPYSFLLDDGKTGYIRVTRFSATTSDDWRRRSPSWRRADGAARTDLRNNSAVLNQAIEVTDKFIGGTRRRTPRGGSTARASIITHGSRNAPRVSGHRPQNHGSASVRDRGWRCRTTIAPHRRRDHLRQGACPAAVHAERRVGAPPHRGTALHAERAVIQRPTTTGTST